MNTWQKAQKWEQDWWGACVNTYGEEEKQLLYADRMGLKAFHDGKSPYNFDMGGKSVLDIGGGPCSLLLKCVNVVADVVDPLFDAFPRWVIARYNFYTIQMHTTDGERIVGWGNYDEAWIYNILQHTQDPALVIHNARRAAKLIRLFEWIDTPTNEGHPHTLTELQLNEWLGGEGKVEILNGQANCHGKCYYGVFPTGALPDWNAAMEETLWKHEGALKELAK